MTLAASLQKNSIALGRVNNLLERVFTVTMPMITFQMIMNSLGQAEHLNTFWFALSIGPVIVSQIGAIYSVWARGNGKLWFRIFPLATLFAMATWSFQIGNEVLAPGEKPWMWWACGIAAIASIGGFGVTWSSIISVAIPVAWWFVQTSNFGGAIEGPEALKDSVYTFLFSSVIMSMVWVLRWRSTKVDIANQLAADAAMDLARTDAIERERSRVDALVHDSVMTTLIMASNAGGAEEQHSARELADVAIAKLNNLDADELKVESISVGSLFQALESAALRQSPNIAVDIEGASDDLIPGNVASALTEATLQAITNSLLHASIATERGLLLRNSSKGLKIVIRDNGRGFRVSSVSRNRLGIRVSIIRRVESVGGRVFIDSKLGLGTNIILEWSADDSRS